MVRKAAHLKVFFRLILLGWIGVACARTPHEPPLDLPDFEEAYPQIDTKWLAEKLHQSQADGVFVLTADGTLATQELGKNSLPTIGPKPSEKPSYLWCREMEYSNPNRIAQLSTVLFLIEPGCKADVFMDMYEICHGIPKTQDTFLIEWNQERMIEQRTRISGSHSLNYPEYGLFLVVEAAKSSSEANRRTLSVDRGRNPSKPNLPTPIPFQTRQNHPPEGGPPRTTSLPGPGFSASLPQCRLFLC